MEGDQSPNDPEAERLRRMREISARLIAMSRPVLRARLVRVLDRALSHKLSRLGGSLPRAAAAVTAMRQDQWLKEGSRFFVDRADAPTTTIGMPYHPPAQQRDERLFRPIREHQKWLVLPVILMLMGVAAGLAILKWPGLTTPLLASCFALVGVGLAWFSWQLLVSVRGRVLSIAIIGVLCVALIVVDYRIPGTSEVPTPQLSPIASPSVIGDSPIMTHWPPRFFTLRDGRIRVDVGLYNTTAGPAFFTHYGVVTLGSSATGDLARARILTSLVERVDELATTGMGERTQILPHAPIRPHLYREDTAYSTVAAKPISARDLAAIQRGDKYIYFYSLILTTFGNGTSTSLRECAIAFGAYIERCPRQFEETPRL